MSHEEVRPKRWWASCDIHSLPADVCEAHRVADHLIFISSPHRTASLSLNRRRNSELPRPSLTYVNRLTLGIILSIHRCEAPMFVVLSCEAVFSMYGACNFNVYSANTDIGRIWPRYHPMDSQCSVVLRKFWHHFTDHRVMNELGWKPWATTSIRRGRYQSAEIQFYYCITALHCDCIRRRNGMLLHWFYYYVMIRSTDEIDVSSATVVALMERVAL